MSNTGKLTSGQWALMEVLWDRERATASEVAEALESSRGWAYSTVKTQLDRMVNNGLVKVRLVGRSREYSPGITRGAARSSAWRWFVQAAFGGAAAPALQFVASESLTAEQIDVLEKLLEVDDGE
jgi:predicted transcriptional regulator